MTYKQIKAHQRAKGQTKAFTFNHVTRGAFKIITHKKHTVHPWYHTLIVSTCLFPGPVIYDPLQPNVRHATLQHQCKHIRECLRRAGFEG